MYVFAVFAVWSFSRGLGLHPMPQCSSNWSTQCHSLWSQRPMVTLDSCEKPLGNLLFLNLFPQYQGYTVLGLARTILCLGKGKSHKLLLLIVQLPSSTQAEEARDSGSRCLASSAPRFQCEHFCLPSVIVLISLF